MKKDARLGILRKVHIVKRGRIIATSSGQDWRGRIIATSSGQDPRGQQPAVLAAQEREIPRK